MCSFLITNLCCPDVELANRFQRLRGPDLTTIRRLNGITFLHNLLSITGTFTAQPFFGCATACVYNGEIYNHRDFGEFKSDGECILPLYEVNGPRFVSLLDGEFAIAIVDWSRSSIFISTDIFGTKPVYYSLSHPHFGISSYASALNALGFQSVTQLEPNSYVVISLKDHSLSFNNVMAFDLRQHKCGFDDWRAAFSGSIAKRAQGCREKIFIGLSSGYDSGAISCELDSQGIAYKSYTIATNENLDVIKKRHSRRICGAEYEVMYPANTEKQEAIEYLGANIEPVSCDIVSARNDYKLRWRLHEDRASIGLAIICKKARQEGRRIYISGQGADEIFSDYAMNGRAIYSHSNFEGVFPDDLSSIFPWASFFASSQAAYLAKEEYIAGAFGIETRYPFLDKAVVQEFLWLTPQLKNATYKSVLRNVLEESDYPACFDQKLGFQP